jgi:hypothetical protein
MSSIRHDCPYCGSASSSFVLLVDKQSQVFESYWHALGRCGVCKEVALIKLVDVDRTTQKVAYSTSPSEFGVKGVIEARYRVLDFHPEVKQSDVPESIPENVHSAFSEAEIAFSRGLFSSAGACYRKALERAVKSLHPDGKGTLHARIKELKGENLLPKTLIDLLDRVRILGNQSVHDEDIDPTKEDCEIARNFARLFLIYTFSLPAQVNAFSTKVDPQ